MTGPIGEITLQTIPMPADSNANGDIFGGWLMSQMDLGASVLARTRARGRGATGAVDGVEAHKPVKVGDVLAIYSIMEREGRTSMKIGVEAWITRMPSGDHMRVTKATFTFVAIDDAGKPRALPAG
jgi:acyl-CoA thioesterase YciA